MCDEVGVKVKEGGGNLHGLAQDYSNFIANALALL